MNILIIGAAIVDIIMKIPKLPLVCEDILCTEKIETVGGCAYNVSNMLKNFNVDHDLFVPIGTGIYADIIKTDLHKDNQKILINDENYDNGYSLCLVQGDGERTFITYNGIEANFKYEWLKKLKDKQYDIIYISGYQLLGSNGEILSSFIEKQKNSTVFFAPGPVINKIEKDVLNKIFLAHPIVHLNEKEALDFTKKENPLDSINTLYNLTNNTCIITLGEYGSLFYDGDNLTKVPGKKATVVDTIGAGDSHIATIISLFSKGYDLLSSCELANFVASKMVQVQGAKMDKKDFNNLNIPLKDFKTKEDNCEYF